jgi:pectate lyase
MSYAAFGYHPTNLADAAFTEFDMKRAHLVITLAVLAILVSVATAAQAQTQTPNFSGRWALVPDPAAQGPGGGLGQSAVIKQDAGTMTINRTTQMGEVTTVYKLDGSESKNTLNFQGNALEQLSKTKWEGGTLHVATTMNFDGNAVNVTMAMSLDPSGNLIVVSTRPDFQGGGSPVTTKATYKKSE